MAIKPNENETFYREVDEGLRKDQMADTFRKHGWLIAGGVVLLFAAIGGFIWWQNQQEAKAGARGEALTDILQDVQAGRTKGVEPKIEELVESGSPGYRAAAMLTRANIAIEAGNNAAAIATLKAMAEDDGFAEPYRQLALVRQTALEFDTLTPAIVLQRLQPLAQAGNPWFGSAGELVAIAHLKQQRPDLAAPIFSAISRDENVPASIRSRAVQMAGALGVDAVVETPAARGAPPPAAGEAATKEKAR